MIHGPISNCPFKNVLSQIHLIIERILEIINSDTSLQNTGTFHLNSNKITTIIVTSELLKGFWHLNVILENYLKPYRDEIQKRNDFNKLCLKMLIILLDYSDWRLATAEFLRNIPFKSGYHIKI